MAKLKRKHKAIKKRSKQKLRSKSHWVGLKPEPSKYFGFIYCIHNKINGRKYIGKKQYYIAKPGSPKGRNSNRLSDKWKDSHWKLSDWETYTGSSKELNRGIKEHGKHNFEFEILNQQTCKGDLHYAEIKEQIDRNVLTEMTESGDHLYYNKSIPGIKFRPPSFLTRERREALSERMKGEGNSVHKALANGNHCTKGKGHTEEAKENMRKAQRAFYDKLSDEDKDRRRQSYLRSAARNKGTGNHKFRPWAYKEPGGEWVEVHDKTIKDWYTENGYPKVKIDSKYLYNKRRDAFYYKWEFKILEDLDDEKQGS